MSEKLRPGRASFSPAVQQLEKRCARSPDTTTARSCTCVCVCTQVLKSGKERFSETIEPSDASRCVPIGPRELRERTARGCIQARLYTAESKRYSLFYENTLRERERGGVCGVLCLRGINAARVWDVKIDDGGGGCNWRAAGWKMRV